MSEERVACHARCVADAWLLVADVCRRSPRRRRRGDARRCRETSRSPAVGRDALRKHANANAAEVDGTTALHWAARGGDPAMVELARSRGRQRERRQSLRREAAVAGVRSRQCGGRRAAARCRRRSEYAAAPKAKRALMTAARAGSVEAVEAADRARRRGQREGNLARADRADVGRGRRATRTSCSR